MIPQAVIYIFATEASRQPEPFSATATTENNLEARTPEAFASQLIESPLLTVSLLACGSMVFNLDSQLTLQTSH